METTRILVNSSEMKRFIRSFIAIDYDLDIEKIQIDKEDHLLIWVTINYGLVSSLYWLGKISYYSF